MLSLCCLFGVCFYCSLLYCVCVVLLLYDAKILLFLLSFPFWCYCVIFTHINIMPFLCCVRTQTKFNCVRTQCVIFSPDI